MNRKKIEQAHFNQQVQKVKNSAHRAVLYGARFSHIS